MGVCVDATDERYGRWGCWRDPAHRGRSPGYLIRLLTRWTREQIDSYLQDGATTSSSWADLKKRFRQREETADPGRAPFTSLVVPDEFRTIRRTLGSTRRFWEYLKGRGFPEKDVAELVALYRLRCANRGRFRGRIIVPFLRHGKCYGWTGRAIGKATVRYLSHPEGNEVKRSVGNFDEAREGGDVLAIVEGPFDRLKFDFYGRHEGVRVVELLGVSVSSEQKEDLRALALLFSSVSLVLDRAAAGVALRLKRELPDLGMRLRLLPEGIKDPGDLTPAQARRFARSLRK